MRYLILLAAAALALPAQPQRTNPVVIENEQVRVLKVTDSPRGKGRLHEHAMNRVLVYLNDGHIVLEYEGGKTDDQKVKAGEVRWSAAGGKHSSENVGGGPVEIVEIELKSQPGPESQPGGKSEPGSATLDPVKVDPAHYTVLFENDQVRAVRVNVGPHEKIPRHEHTLARVMVFLTGVSSKMTAADGAVSQGDYKAGEVVFAAGAVSHAEENLLAAAIEVVIVELKK
jgi:quercetin dioxygenase-like cupin family protein